jgi:hypothetical protein
MRAQKTSAVAETHDRRFFLWVQAGLIAATFACGIIAMLAALTVT